MSPWPSSTLPSTYTGSAWLVKRTPPSSNNACSNIFSETPLPRMWPGGRDASCMLNSVLTSDWLSTNRDVSLSRIKVLTSRLRSSPWPWADAAPGSFADADCSGTEGTVLARGGGCWCWLGDGGGGVVISLLLSITFWAPLNIGVGVVSGVVVVVVDMGAAPGGGTSALVGNSPRPENMEKETPKLFTMTTASIYHQVHSPCANLKSEIFLWSLLLMDVNSKLNFLKPIFKGPFTPSESRSESDNFLWCLPFLLLVFFNFACALARCEQALSHVASVECKRTFTIHTLVKVTPNADVNGLFRQLERDPGPILGQTLHTAT